MMASTLLELIVSILLLSSILGVKIRLKVMSAAPAMKTAADFASQNETYSLTDGVITYYKQF